MHSNQYQWQTVQLITDIKFCWIFQEVEPIIGEELCRLFPDDPSVELSKRHRTSSQGEASSSSRRVKEKDIHSRLEGPDSIIYKSSLLQYGGSSGVINKGGTLMPPYGVLLSMEILHALVAGLFCVNVFSEVLYTSVRGLFIICLLSEVIDLCSRTLCYVFTDEGCLCLHFPALYVSRYHLLHYSRVMLSFGALMDINMDLMNIDSFFNIEDMFALLFCLGSMDFFQTGLAT